jgi:hypothetical protein
MRNLYYEKSNYNFRKLKSLIEAKELPEESELLQKIYEFAELLSICLSYAKSSIFCGKSDKIAPYSQDHQKGILQEEVLLAYFLEEQISSVRYIISLVETNMRVQAFANNGMNEIFVSHIIENINELSQDTEKDLRYFYDNMEKRYTIGNKLFGILQELQNFR